MKEMKKSKKADVFDPLKSAHEGSVWGICAIPDESGFVTCSGDKTIKFWEWTLVAMNRKDKNGLKKLTATHSKTLQMADDVLAFASRQTGNCSRIFTRQHVESLLCRHVEIFASPYGHRYRRFATTFPRIPSY